MAIFVLLPRGSSYSNFECLCKLNKINIPKTYVMSLSTGALLKIVLHRSRSTQMDPWKTNELQMSL